MLDLNDIVVFARVVEAGSFTAAARLLGMPKTTVSRLTYRRPSQHNIHVRGYKEHGNINTPLELAIRNETDRFTLAMDAIDRIPRVRVSAAGLRDELANQRIACEQHAYRFGIDRPDITAWKWPY